MIRTLHVIKINSVPMQAMASTPLAARADISMITMTRFLPKDLYSGSLASSTASIAQRKPGQFVGPTTVVQPLHHWCSTLNVTLQHHLTCFVLYILLLITC
jgi:hypothetical protein